MVLWSKEDLKQKCFLIRLTLILTVLFFDKDVTGAALSNEDLTKAFKQLEVKFEADQTKYDSTISNLQNELESFKNQSSKWREDEQKSNNETKIVVDRLDKMSRIGTSCSSIASLGIIVSGNYFLDTDGQGNHAPYEAYCKMPERTTIVGNDIALDFENCNGAFCSEKIINLDAPLPQLVLLVDKSPSCGQTVTFKCQSAPISIIESNQNGFEVTSYLQWRDRHGQYHNITGGENCNKKWPQMDSDSFELNDRSLLPVTGLRYGPLEFEWQKAKVLVSKLKCDPYEYVSLNERLEKLENASNPLVELLKNPVFSFKCPTDDNNYKLINNVCYYFERRALNYYDAQLNCRTMVGQLGGHLFEPYTKEISMEVYEMAKTVLGTSNHYLIGINSIGRSGTEWQYPSDGSPKRFTDYGYGSRLDGANECATIQNGNGHAEDQSCTTAYYSICENKFATSEE